MATTAEHSALIPRQTVTAMLDNMRYQSAMLARASVSPMSGQIEDVVTPNRDAWNVPETAANVGELEEKPVVQPFEFQSSEMIARKMAAIVLVSDEVKNDSVLDILAFYQAEIESFFAMFIDRFALSGGQWAGSEGILPAVTALGGNHVVAPSADSPFQDTSAMLAGVEQAGRNPSGYIFDISQKARFRDALDANGRPLFAPSVAEGEPSTVHGYPANFLGDSVFSQDPGGLVGIAGDFAQYRIGIREDMNAEIATTGTVPYNGQQVNLFTQNATALRVEMRLGAKVLDARSFSVLQNPETATA